MIRCNTVFSFILGVLSGAGVSKVFFKNEQKEQSKEDKYFQIYKNWLTIKCLGESLNQYLEKNNYKSVAIYGCGRIGKNLLLDLNSQGVLVSYMVDRNQGSKVDKLDVYQPIQRLPDVDIMIVTPVMEFEDISKTLKTIFTGKIVSLEDVIYECI